MAAAATTTTAAATPALFSPCSRSTWSSRSRVECCASYSSNSTAIGSKLRCPATALAPSRLVLPPALIPVPAVIEVDWDEEDELTFLPEYDDEDGRQSNKRSSPWLSSHYLSLRLRCSSLMKQEATDALSRHFKGREPTVSVSSMLNSTPTTTTTTTSAKVSRPGEKKSTDKLNRISESYHGDTVKFIKDVLLSDEQPGYFEHWPVNSSTAH